MMNLQEALDVVPFEFLRFGCQSGDVRSRVREKSNDGFKVVEQYENLKTHPDSQKLGSCTCNSFTGLMEWWIYKMHHRAVQLDYEKLYKQVRLDRGNMSDSGARLDEPFMSAIKHGWLPYDTEHVRVKNNVKSICKALEYSPMVAAMSVHNGWSPKNLNRDNGAVKESLGRTSAVGMNGHAMLMVGSNDHNDTPMFVIRNSWGALGQLGHGLTCCSIDHYNQWSIDNPLQILLRDAFNNWDGWEQYVVAEG